jgi:hypothetical protein
VLHVAFLAARLATVIGVFAAVALGTAKLSFRFGFGLPAALTGRTNGVVAQVHRGSPAWFSLKCTAPSMRAMFEDSRHGLIEFRPLQVQIVRNILLALRCLPSVGASFVSRVKELGRGLVDVMAS